MAVWSMNDDGNDDLNDRWGEHENETELLFCSGENLARNVGFD